MNTLYYGDNLNILLNSTTDRAQNGFLSMVFPYPCRIILTPAGFEAFKKAGKANKPDPRQQDLGI